MVNMSTMVMSLPKQFGKTLFSEAIQQTAATAFEAGARAYAAIDPCCGTFHLHEIINPYTDEAIPTREGEDDL